MSRYSSGDGQTRVQFVTTLSSMTSPTAVQLNAGDNWSSFIQKDGLTVPADQNVVDTAALSDTFNASVPGSFGGSIEITAQRDNVSDTVWDQIQYGLTGFLVIRRGVPVASTFSAGDKVEVYPVVFHEPVPGATSGDTVDSFSAMAPVTSQPNLKATVV